MTRLRILLIAYACSPVRGSEPGMGWRFVLELAKYHDVSVITEKEKFEKEVEKGLVQNPELNKHAKFFFIEKKRYRRLRKLWPPSYYWFYRQWHKKAFELARSLDQENKFDIVHQLNMVGYREPGYVWQIDAPFVWGPVGGMSQFPWYFLGCIGVGGAIHHVGRNLLNIVQKHLLPRPRVAAKKAGVGLIAATSEMQRLMKSAWGVESTVICEVGQLEINEIQIQEKGHEIPLRVVWSGQHIPGKALPLLLKALKGVDSRVDWKLDVLGNGPETNHWKKCAEQLLINDHCIWHSWLPRERAVDVMRLGHVFVITSLKDLTSTVTMEALSLGLPIICLDHCGFADVVTANCGIKIPLTTPNKVVCEITQAIEHLWDDEFYRQKLAAGALDRAMEFSWDGKIRELNGIYKRVLIAKANGVAQG